MRKNMRAHLSPLLHLRLHPHELRLTARSAFLPLPILLVVRVFSTALLAGHTTLFSATGSYRYLSFSVWANTMLLLSMLSLSLSSLLELITDTEGQDVGDNVDNAFEILPSQTSASQSNSLTLHRILPTLAIPLSQTAGSTVILSAMLHWIFARTKIPPVAEAMYATLALHLLNPFIFLLDMFLVATADTRILYIPISYVLSIAYILFSFIFMRVRHINLFSNISRHGVRGIVAAVALALLTPIATYGLSLLPIIVAVKCTTEEDEHTGSEKQFDEELGTDASSETPDVKIHGEMQCNTMLHTEPDILQCGAASSIHCPNSNSHTSSPAHAIINTPHTPPHRVTERESPQQSPERLSKRASAQSLDHSSTARTLSTRLSLRSSMRTTDSTTSSKGMGENAKQRKDARMRRSSKRISSTGSDVFSTSVSEASMAWSEVGDVVVEMGKEYFRMPECKMEDAMRLQRQDIMM